MYLIYYYIILLIVNTNFGACLSIQYAYVFIQCLNPEIYDHGNTNYTVVSLIPINPLICYL